MRFAPATQRLLREAALRLGLLMLEVGLIGLCTLANIRLDETRYARGVLLSCAEMALQKLETMDTKIICSSQTL